MHSRTRGNACKSKRRRYAEDTGTPCAMVYGLYVVSSVYRA
jgi:hypothetical protein